MMVYKGSPRVDYYNSPKLFGLYDQNSIGNLLKYFYANNSTLYIYIYYTLQSFTLYVLNNVD